MIKSGKTTMLQTKLGEHFKDLAKKDDFYKPINQGEKGTNYYPVCI